MPGGGLEGVVVASSSLCRIFGEEGRLVYRGYDIEELARETTFEEVAYLLWYGRLPARRALEEFRAALVRERAVDPVVLRILEALPPATHPMAALRTGVSVLGAADPEAEDQSEASVLRKAARLAAKMPTIAAAAARLAGGRESIAPRADLGHAANFLYMITGEEPGELEARVFDVALILHAEHGMNASTFAARVTTATLSDPYSAVVSAIGTLKGPLHGGANERVMEMLESIGEPGRAAGWVRSALERKERIMGFGHRVYRAKDPRARILEGMGRELARARGDGRLLEVAGAVETAMAEEMGRRGKAIFPNVDFYSAPVYHTLGIPRALFTPIFACSRITGWMAHILEQLGDNRLIRPRAEYVGPLGLRVTPLEARSE